MNIKKISFSNHFEMVKLIFKGSTSLPSHLPAHTNQKIIW